MICSFGLRTIIPSCPRISRNDFPKADVSFLAFTFLLLLLMIRSLTKILKIMNKKAVLKMVLTAARYVITLALGYLCGDSDLISQIV